MILLEEGVMDDDPEKAKSNHKRLAHRTCHPERSEGSHGQILRFAQNDSHRRLQDPVYQCPMVRFRRRPTRWRVALMVMLGLVLGIHWAAFAAEEGKKYEGKVVYQKTVLGKEYRIET